MPKKTMNSFRNQIAVRTMIGRGLAHQQKTKFDIVRRAHADSGDPLLAATLAQQSKRERRAADRNKFSQINGGKRRRRSRTTRRKDYRSPECFDQVGANVGRSYSSRKGELMESKKAGFPDVMRHPTTILLGAVPVTELLNEASNAFRRRLRKCLSELTHAAQVEGMFQFKIVTAAQAARYFPEIEWPLGLDPEKRPNELFALLHLHADVSDPYLSKDNVRKLIVEHFPGTNRVCVRKVRPIEVNDEGQETAGGQGWFEYMALDKTDYDLSDPDIQIAALTAHAKMNATWSKRNKSFSFGKALSVSGVQIDPARVAELEQEERFQWIKKNWTKMLYAVQFIHIWFSGAISVIVRSKKWISLGATSAERFLNLLPLVKKWSRSPNLEHIDFLDFLEVSLE